MEQLFQLIAGGLLLSLLVYWKGHEIYEIISETLRSRKRKQWLPLAKAVTGLVISVLIASIMIEPLISGNATINVKAPKQSNFPTTLENLRIRATPVGLLGESAGKFERISRFDKTGYSSFNINLGVFQSRVAILVIHKPSTSSGGPGEVLPFRGKMH